MKNSALTLTEWQVLHEKETCTWRDLTDRAVILA